MHKEYIEREKAYELARTDSLYSDFCRSMADLTSLKELLEDTPAADVVEVIRCKDCKHATFYTCKNDRCYNRIICDYEVGTGDENFFCSYGERKEEE